MTTIYNSGTTTDSYRQWRDEQRRIKASDDELTALDDACEFLRSELDQGPKPAKYLLGEGRQAGHSERTIKRAKAKLGIESRKESSGWLWSMTVEGAAKRAKDAKEAKESTSKNLGTVGTLGTVDGESEVF